MLYRFQFILCKYESKFSVTQSFDMFPSKVIFDGQRVHFTPKSIMAYKYMINEIMLDGGSDIFKHRVSKYFKYGFSIVFPPTDRLWYSESHENTYNYADSMYSGPNENKGPISFQVRRIRNNQIIIAHNSNIEKMLERNEELEQQCLDNSKALYVSTLFCSFVSILRYVEINGIDYAFPQTEQFKFSDQPTTGTESVKTPEYVPTTPADIGFTSSENASRFKFNDRTLDVKFMEKFHTLYEDRSWFTKFFKSMLLNDADDFVEVYDESFKLENPTAGTKVDKQNDQKADNESDMESVD